MTSIYYELYISRDADVPVSDGEILELLKEFIPEGWDQTGCGAGCGTRDLDIRLNMPLTKRNVVDLQNRLRNRFETEVLDVLYEEWPENDDEPSIAYSGDDPLDEDDP